MTPWTLPEGYDPLGFLDGDVIPLADAAKLPPEDRCRVEAVSLADGSRVRPWVVGGVWNPELNGVETMPDGSTKVWLLVIAGSNSFAHLHSFKLTVQGHSSHR